MFFNRLLWNLTSLNIILAYNAALCFSYINVFICAFLWKVDTGSVHHSTWTMCIVLFLSVGQIQNLLLAPTHKYSMCKGACLCMTEQCFLTFLTFECHLARGAFWGFFREILLQSEPRRALSYVFGYYRHQAREPDEEGQTARLIWSRKIPKASTDSTVLKM